MSLSYDVLYDAYRQMYPTWNPGQLHQAVVKDTRWNGSEGPVIDPSPGPIDPSGGTLYTYAQLWDAYTVTYPHFSKDQKHQAILVDTRWNGIGGPNRPPPDPEPDPKPGPAPKPIPPGFVLPPEDPDRIPPPKPGPEPSVEDPDKVLYTWLELKDAWETMNPDWTQDQVYAAIRKDDRWNQIEPDLDGGADDDVSVEPVPEPQPGASYDDGPDNIPSKPQPGVDAKLSAFWIKHKLKVFIGGALLVGLVVLVRVTQGSK